METMPELKPLIGLTLAQLRDVAAECAMPRFAAGQMARWLYQKRVESIDSMTDLSMAARQRLKERYRVGRKAPLGSMTSVDGTVKYVFDGVGGRRIESVMIPDGERATLCISSQAGCRMNCAFCATGRNGFDGQLSAADIINQVLSVDNSRELTNIVFMGMGEPMDNLQAVLSTIEILTSEWGLAWSPKRITVSTIGKLKELKTLIETTSVHIALSVHSPISEERARLMPVEKAYPLRDVMQLIRGYDWRHQRRFSVEYIMWRDLNDDLRHAEMLARVVRGTDCRVNLIRFHAFEGVDLQPTSRQKMEAFRDRLNALGITATIRASRGEDIMAACGMLAGKATTRQQTKTLLW